MWSTDDEESYQRMQAELHAKGAARREALGGVRKALAGCRKLPSDVDTIEGLVSVAPALVAALLPWAPGFSRLIVMAEEFTPAGEGERIYPLREEATDAEARAGVDASLPITPSLLQSWQTQQRSSGMLVTSNE